MLLEDEDGDQDAASSEELVCNQLRNQQGKNTANLGTTTLPKQGARKQEKPSANLASPELDQEKSLEQRGQTSASASLRTPLEKTRFMEQMELDAEKETSNLQEQEKKEISLRILLTLSLLNQWPIATTKASTACKEELLAEHLQELGLEQTKIDHNIFFGDELVVMTNSLDILIGGEQLQHELFLDQLSAKLPLEQATRLEDGTSISFIGRSLEYSAFMNCVSLQVPACFYLQLLQRHDLEEAESLTSLEEELGQEAPRQSSRPLGAKRSKLYKQTVAELIWSTTCRPDLSFPIQQLQNSLGDPTRADEQQLHRVLRYIKGTLDLSLNLRPKSKMTEEKAWISDLLAFSATSWAEPFKTTSVAYLTLWGVPLVTSCRTKGAYNQTQAEVDSVNLAALALALYTRNLLQQLRVDCLGELVNIQVKMSSLNVMLVTGRPLAMQLGLSHRHKHIGIGSEKGQLQISRVTPEKNFAQSLTYNPTASIQHRLLPKLRLASKDVQLWTLCTGLGFESSFLVGMLTAEAPKMAQHHLRKLDLQKPVADSFHRTSFESLPKTLPSLSLESRASLTLHRLSLQKDSLPSLILKSLSKRDILASLILPSESLRRASLPSLTSKSLSLQRDLLHSLTLQSLSFPMGILGSLDQEKVENIELTKAKGGAETNSFCQLVAREDGTNIFSKQSFPYRILSLKRRVPTFQLSSFQFLWVALLLGAYCFSMSFSSLSDQFNRISFQSFSEQLCNRSLESLNQQSSLQLDFDKIELDAVELGSKSCRTQLQQQQFQPAQLTQQHLLKPADQDRIESLKRSNLSEKKLDKISFEFNKMNPSAYSNQLRQQQFSNQNSNKKLDCRTTSLREKEVVEQLVDSKLLFSQLQQKPF